MSYDVTIRRREPAALLDLRGRPEEVAAAVARVGLGLPEQPNSRVGAGDLELLWLGPRRWLLAGPAADGEALAARLEPGHEQGRPSVVDITGALAGFAILGPDAATVLAVASPLDTHPAVFPGNGATFTDAFGIEALVVRRPGGFELAVERSFADMTADFLERITAVPLERA